MMGKYVTYDFTEFQSAFNKLTAAAKGELRKSMGLWLESAGYEFLNVLRDRIVQQNIMDTRLLLHSFHKGGEGNIWDLDMGDLLLEVGTNVEYAWWVENGHKQQPGRFIPGSFDAQGRFVYEKGAKTGIVLKASMVKGRHYFDHSVTVFEPLYRKALENSLQKWLDSLL